MIDKDSLMTNNRVYSNSLDKQVIVREILKDGIMAYDPEVNSMIQEKLEYKDLLPIGLTEKTLVEKVGMQNTRVISGTEISSKGLEIDDTYKGIIEVGDTIWILFIEHVRNGAPKITLKCQNTGETQVTQKLLYLHELQNYVKIITSSNIVIF